MSNTWLIEARPESFEVTEQHWLEFDIGNNDSHKQRSAQMEAFLRIPVDGDRYLRQRSLIRAALAQKDGDQARMGIVGLAAAELKGQVAPGRGRRRGTIETTFKEGLAQSNHLASNDSLITWPLDIPAQLEANLAKRPPGDPDQVCVYKVCLPIAPPEIHPLTIKAELQIVGDDLPVALQRLSDLKGLVQSKEVQVEISETTKTVVQAILRPTSDRSVFCLIIWISIAPWLEGVAPSADLVRFALDWPPGGDGRDITLERVFEQDPSQEISGRYDPNTKRVEFLWPGARSKSLRLDSQHPGIVIVMRDPTVFSSMEPIKGVIEVELEGLASGLRPFMADVSGRIIAGLGENGSALRPGKDHVNIFADIFADIFGGLRQRTLLTADFKIDLEAKFRGRPVAHQTRLQFPSRRFREDQIRQVKTLFRDCAFPDPVHYKTGSGSHLLCTQRTVGGDKQHLVFYIVSEKRNVSLESHALSGTKETRNEELDDITVDVAAVGPNYEDTIKLMADLQPGIESILGAR